MHVSEVQVGDNLFFFKSGQGNMNLQFFYRLIWANNMYTEIVKVMWTCWGVYRLIKQNRTCIEISLIKKIRTSLYNEQNKTLRYWRVVFLDGADVSTWTRPDDHQVGVLSGVATPLNKNSCKQHKDKITKMKMRLIFGPPLLLISLGRIIPLSLILKCSKQIFCRIGPNSMLCKNYNVIHDPFTH